MHHFSVIIPVLLLLLLLLLFFSYASGFGSMGPIAAALGDDGFFCAIDAGGYQEVICWTNNSSSESKPISQSSSPSSSISPISVPAMAALSGGEGFLCGILANTSHAFCWNSLTSDLVPSIHRTTTFSHIAAGKNHVCAIRGAYYSDDDLGPVDCWDIVKDTNNSFIARQSSLFYNQSISSLVFQKIVSGEGFSCGRVREGGIVCWGPNSQKLGISTVTENLEVLASARASLCGILERSREIKCWGSNSDLFLSPSIGIRFVSLSAGDNHFCGIREDNHAVECWGSFNSSLVPKGGSGFMAIASSDLTTCGIREDDLVLDCWFANATSPPKYNPPLELCSPGLCSPGSCREGAFAFNASLINELDLTSLCLRKDLQICSSCGSNCTEGFFLSSPCTANADRICTSCSLCQNSSCIGVCKVKPQPDKRSPHLDKFEIIIGSCASAFILIMLSWFIIPHVINARKDKNHFKSCVGKPDMETNSIANLHSSPSITAPCPGMAQVFRLSELKDATNGFKEFNELGRGSYGFVYKAVLADGCQIAVKRANAATIIHTSTRDYEMELEILCKIRHPNIVNLLGYCSELGERLLVYEYMPHGTLHDHLHGGLSPLNWNLRLNISMQAAKGLVYLHKEFVPPISHRDFKTSNILLDSDWGARITDFGLLTSSERDINEEIKNDVYNFGIVLLEILSGRKACDIEYTPSGIVEWAVPLIKQGKAAALIDRCVALPRNVEPLLKLADIAALVVRRNPLERPTMSEIVLWLEPIVKEGLVL